MEIYRILSNLCEYFADIPIFRFKMYVTALQYRLSMTEVLS